MRAPLIPSWPAHPAVYQAPRRPAAGIWREDGRLHVSAFVEVLLPRTDAGALAQVVVAVVVTATLVAVTRSAEACLLVLGIGLVALGWMALRILH